MLKLHEAAGNPEVFEKKVAWLQQKWCGQTIGSAESRLMSPILALPTSPINLAVIADNLDYFRAHYHKDQMNSVDFLKKACLCGSQGIGNFLLEELGLSCNSPGYEYIFSYVSASKNLTWIKEIATKMAMDKKQIPEDIYRLASFTTIDLIERIFQNPKDTIQYKRTSP